MVLVVPKINWLVVLVKVAAVAWIVEAKVSAPAAVMDQLVPET